MHDNWTLSGGRVVRNGRISVGDLGISDGLIMDKADDAARSFDAEGLLILPGIVDVHGDAFERQIMPRPKVAFDLDAALRETDLQMIGNGITTAYHGLTLSWEPGLRGIDTARGFIEALARLRPSLACDTKLHLRWETFALDSLDEALGWIAAEPEPILAFNDHTTIMKEGDLIRRKSDTVTGRTGLSQEEFMVLLDDVWARRHEVPTAIERAAARARADGATLFAHDETSPEQRRYFRNLGAVASEFPLNDETARCARAAGEHIILGAPNVVRGGSHLGAVNAADSVEAGLCSVLASDYYYPSQLLAAFRLAREGRCGFPEAWDLVSKNAAEAAGLSDRGRLEPGQRADIIIVDDSIEAAPRVVAALVRGRKVLERNRYAAMA